MHFHHQIKYKSDNAKNIYILNIEHAIFSIKCNIYFKSVEFSNEYPCSEYILWLNNFSRTAINNISWIKSRMDSRICCSIAKSCPTLGDTMDCNMPDLPVLPYLPMFAQVHVHWVAMPSNHLILCHLFSLCLQSFPPSVSFPMSWVFASGGQSIGASTSASVLPMNSQGWFPLGKEGRIFYPYCTNWKDLEKSEF